MFKKKIIAGSIKESERIFKKRTGKLTGALKSMVEDKYILLSALKNHFYESLAEFKNKLYKRMMDNLLR